MATIRDLEAKIAAKMITDESAIVGRTVTHFENSYNMEFGFENGTFIVFERQEDYHNCSWIVPITDVKAIGPHEARRLGVLTEQEAVTLTKLRRKSSMDSARTWRRRRYDQLKKEFESNDEEGS